MKILKSVRYSSAIVLGVLLAFQPLLAATEPAPSGDSRLLGKIQGIEGKPLAGVRVLAYHLSSEAVFKSQPTSSKGSYEIEGLPYGYFDLAVETSDGLFVANQVVNVPPSGKTSISMALATEAQAAALGDQARQFPGAEQQPSGVASVDEKATGRDFWRSPKGIAIIAGGGALVLLAIAGGGSSSNNNSSSPSNP
jgi:hypothetical protein